GWTTRMNDQCEVEWTPPPQLDTGQARLNYYHRPERLLAPPDDPNLPGEPAPSAGPADEHNQTRHDAAAGRVTDHAHETLRPADATTSPTDDDENRPAEPESATRPADYPGEPRGSAPPEGRAA
ncbi:hypothetical protein AB3M98_27130, partial [Mycolicibacterium litorale]